ncbi:hypothetical protein [Streptomyces sp. NBC_01235]|uniref:hypothetical protein n=1 Tax=Streptomyces sp. NBC_01235 TaxID=2903788 RepID=UPI002E155A3A|nr:hypothetical protein OG289_22910 [Streptomyces sp. NBC_01235]
MRSVLHVHSPTASGPETARSVATWLLRAADDVDSARAEWETRKVALLRCGRVFAAIRLPADIVFAAARSERPVLVGHYLAVALHGGAVFVDKTAAWYYCLVPPGTCRDWRMPGTDCLDDDHFLGVPRVDVTGPENRSYWCVVPAFPEALCRPDAVAHLVELGRFRRTHGPEAKDD